MLPTYKLVRSISQKVVFLTTTLQQWHFLFWQIMSNKIVQQLFYARRCWPPQVMMTIREKGLFRSYSLFIGHPFCLIFVFLRVKRERERKRRYIVKVKRNNTIKGRCINPVSWLRLNTFLQMLVVKLLYSTYKLVSKISTN